MSKWERNRILPKESVRVERPSLPEEVPPTLRFLLSPDVMEDGEKFFSHINNRVSWSNIPGHLLVGFMEQHIVGKLAVEWPQVANANDHFGGLLVEVLRAYAANPKMPGWWKSPFMALAKGRPGSIRSACEGILGIASVPLPDVVYEEDKPDPVLRQAARHWQDRDANEVEKDYA